MVLAPLEAGKKNRILRNIGLMFLQQDINQLDKHGYNFLYLASGFIAHYNLGGFIEHYGSTQALGRDILDNKSNNQWGNFREGERDYEYMMEKKDIYNRICAFANGNFGRIPAEEDCFKPTDIKTLFDEEPEWRASIEKAYRQHLAYGNYFNASDPQRVVDLADITMAYDKQVVNGNMKDSEFFNMEVALGGGAGTASGLLDCYRDQIWEIFNHYSGRAFEMGYDDPLSEDENEEE